MRIWRPADLIAASSKMLLAAAVSLLLFTLAACQLISIPGLGSSPPPSPSASISICDNGTPDCDPATSFSVSTARDLIITANYRHLPPGNHIQLLEIMIPAGGPYQVTQLALNADNSGGSYTTTRIFPVAATWIPQRHITGDWTVQVSLDGQVMATQVVTLNP